MQITAKSKITFKIVLIIGQSNLLSLVYLKKTDLQIFVRKKLINVLKMQFTQDTLST